MPPPPVRPDTGINPDYAQSSPADPTRGGTQTPPPPYQPPAQGAPAAAAPPAAAPAMGDAAQRALYDSDSNPWKIGASEGMTYDLQVLNTWRRRAAAGDLAAIDLLTKIDFRPSYGPGTGDTPESWAARRKLVQYDAAGDAAGTGAYGSYMAPTGQRVGYANADDAIKGGVPERGYLRSDADPANAGSRPAPAGMTARAEAASTPPAAHGDYQPPQVYDGEGTSRPASADFGRAMDSAHAPGMDLRLPEQPQTLGRRAYLAR
jgi:hypothetical protein